MKTNYHLRGKRKSRIGAKFIAAIVLCLIIGYFAKGPVARVLGSLSYFVGNIVGAVVPPGFRGALALGKENQQLRDKIMLLSAENADRNVLALENRELKERLGRTEEDTIVHATVLEKPPLSPFDTFLLDAGTNHGIKNGDIVIIGNLSIGVIVEAGKSYSKAELYSSPGKVFEGRLGSKGISIQAEGEGGGMFQAMIPIGTEVSEGDTLILPSISPKVFGIVEKVEELTNEGFKKILFGLPINPSEVTSVGVIIDEDR